MEATTNRTNYIAHDVRLGELHSEWYAASHRAGHAAATAASYRKLNNTAKAEEFDAIAHDASAEAAAVLVKIDTHEEGYTGWSRFFLVTSSHGHIHSSLRCSTCHRTTTYRALPDLSGLTEADAVADQGEILCSVCFPSAPAEWTNGVAKSTLAERDAKAAERAERQAAKLAKALLPSGDGFRVDSITTLNTIVAARNWLTSEFVDSVWYERDVNADMIVTVAGLLADRTGEDAAELIAAARVKAAKKVRKELRDAANSPILSQPSMNTPEMLAARAASDAERERRLAELEA